MLDDWFGAIYLYRRFIRSGTWVRYRYDLPQYRLRGAYWSHAEPPKRLPAYLVIERVERWR